MLMAIDKIGRAAEQLAKGFELHHQLGADDFRIEPPQQAGAQQLRKAGKHAAVDRTEMHGQRAKRRGQGQMQADRAARAVRRRNAQRAGLVAAERRADHHRRCRVETAALDQIANAAVDAGTDAVIVGAEPDAARRGVAHSAADLLPSPLSRSASMRFSLCSATK